MTDLSRWTDPLDNMSHVYVPPGGMVGVEVSGGSAHLEPGESYGWIASEIIKCPPGYRYDLVYLEVDTQGDSYVSISVLNASAPPTYIGFANGTIQDLQEVRTTDLSLNELDQKRYPDIRIQVNFYDPLTDQPRLLAWTVYFVNKEEWRDDLLGTGKLSSWGGLNVTSGNAQLRLTDPVLDEDDYEPLPPIALPLYYGLNMLYVDSNGTDYRDPVVESAQPYGQTAFEDMDNDGYLDLVAGDPWTWGKIFWGNSGRTYTTTDMRPLNFHGGAFDLGDFNGDGWKDLAGAVPPAYGSSSVVMLNQGDGVFVKEINISFTDQQYQSVAAGDINGDGYDDVVFTDLPGSKVFFGGRDGPDIVPDAAFDGWDPHVEDLDGDGYDDIVVIFWNASIQKLTVYMGGPSFDTEPDYIIDNVFFPKKINAGDINGDEYKDIVYSSAGLDELIIYPGSSTGWNSTNYHNFSTKNGGSNYHFSLGDLNKDGYEDIAHGGDVGWDGKYTVNVGIGYGGETFPTNATTFRVCRVIGGPYFLDIDFALPKKWRMPLHPWGSLTTEDIHLPDGNKWDSLNLDCNLPAGTWMTVSVLNEEGKAIAGYNKLTGWAVNLSGIDPDINDVIRVKVAIGSDTNTRTPTLDSLQLNWTHKIPRAPPQVRGIEVESPSIYRTQSTILRVDVNDEYDRVRDLDVEVEHRLTGTTDWDTTMLEGLEFDGTERNWGTTVTAHIDVEVGEYEFRVTATDTDYLSSSRVFTGVLEVLNNLPTAPEVRIIPDIAYTNTPLTVEIVTPADDIDAIQPLLYRYRWFRDGEVDSKVRADILTTQLTAKGENWSVEVRAFDGLDEGPPAYAWRTISNAPPHVAENLSDIVMAEDTTDTSIDLSRAFGDVDGDPLTWSLAEEPVNLFVTIDPDTGALTIMPPSDWNGEEELTLVASDGELTAQQTVNVSVISVNDIPWFLTVAGLPVTGGRVMFTMTHGETLVINFSATDVEGDPIWSSIDSTEVDLDEARQEVRVTPRDDFIGSIIFNLSIWDIVSPDEEVTVEFEIVVENVNDPMGTPRILAPPDGSRFKVNESFTLEGTCDDPDVKFGQVLMFTWSSNISGLLGTGTSLTLSLPDVGMHLITLTVGDGEFEKRVTITLIVEPLESIAPPPGSPEDEGIALGIPVFFLIVLIVIGIAVGVSTEPGKYRLGLMFAPLVVRRKEVLDNKTRYALHGIIAERPGIHYSAIKDEFGLSNGAAAYHLDVLERERFIRSVRDGRLKRFYSARTKVTKDQRMTPEEIRVTIMGVVRERPGISQMELIEELGVDRDTVGYHLREMVKEGLLKTDKQWRYTTYRIK
jgi:predicted transcriptional regulator